MAHLDADRASDVKTPAQLQAMAESLSRQASALYRRLGERMAELGNENAHRAFEQLEALQRKHAGAPPDRERGEAPEVFQAEELDKTRLVTPYMAYSVAVRNQERAFAFWSHVSAHATDPAVRAEAERLAHIELDHVRELRSARRRAWRERDDHRLPAAAFRITSLPEFRYAAAARESALARLHRQVAAALAAAGNPVAEKLEAIAQEEAENARGLGGTAQEEDLDLPSGEAEKSLTAAIEQLEAAVEFYLTVAERSGGEDVVAAAQDLADRGIMRLSRLR